MDDKKEATTVHQQHQVDDTTAGAIQLAHELDEAKFSPWTKSMVRLCKYFQLYQFVAQLLI